MSEGEKNDGRSRGSFWQSLTAVLGIALTAACLGFLVWKGLGRDDTPPDITLAVIATVPQRDCWLVTLRVVNHGGSTAAGLKVVGELQNGERLLETSETTLDYVPAHSEREAGLFFTHDPASNELRLRPVGYEKP